MKNQFFRLSLCGVALLATSCVLPLCAQDDEDLDAATPVVAPKMTYDDLMAYANRLVEQGAFQWQPVQAASALQAFGQAIQLAPDDTKRAQAYLGAASIQMEVGDWKKAENLCREALKLKNISADSKAQALLGVAHAEMKRAAAQGTQKQNAAQLRANFDAALRAGKLSPHGEFGLQKAFYSLSSLWRIEENYLEAARAESRILDEERLSVVWSMSAKSVFEMLEKAAPLAAARQADAAAIADKIYKIYAPKIRDEKEKVDMRARYAKLLTLHGQPLRAMPIWQEFLADASTQPSVKAEAIAGLAQAQSVQKKYDEALTTLDRLKELGDAFEIRRRGERAPILLAQGKPSLARSEYLMIALNKTATADQKLDGYWNAADILARDVEKLRADKASTADIKKQEEQWRLFLSVAYTQRDANNNYASAHRRYEVLLKLAGRETLQGQHEAARVWLQKGLGQLDSGKDGWYDYQLQREISKSFRVSKNFADSLNALKESQMWSNRAQYPSVIEDAKSLWKEALNAKDFIAARLVAGELQIMWKMSRKEVLPLLIEMEVAAKNNGVAKAALDEWEKMPLNAQEKKQAATWRAKLS